MIDIVLTGAQQSCESIALLPRGSLSTGVNTSGSAQMLGPIGWKMIVCLGLKSDSLHLWSGGSAENVSS